MSFQEDLNDARKAGIEEGFIEGKSSGIIEGKKSAQIDNAKTMIEENFNDEMISKITKLSLEEIQELRNSFVH